MGKKSRNASSSAQATPPSAPSAPAAAAPPDDPRRRMIANVTMVVVSLYVAMIWLLALDQQFHWGIFKP
ncbi:MAG TPA: hypothetical protein VG838_05025 [Opitutaceae bacterium]|nr:hypothetical protein [Opitutaceae bacterium]